MIWKCTFFFLLGIIDCHSASRKSLLEHSPSLKVIPERLFNLPMQQESDDERLTGQTLSLLEPRDRDSNYGYNSGLKTASSSTRPARYREEHNYNNNYNNNICTGACISSSSCDHHGGHTKGHCTNGNVCCIFYKTCGSVTREKVSFFRSPNFPHSTNHSMECSYRVYPSSSTCALKIDFEKFNLQKPKRYVKVEKCIDDMLFIMNSAYGGSEGLCEMENHTAIVEVDPNSSHPIILLFVTQSPSYSWNLKITQINCKRMPPWSNFPTCGRQLIYEPNEYDSEIQSGALENSQYQSSSTSLLGKGNEDDNQQLPQPRPLIVNGKDAELREFPWQVSLQMEKDSNHRCGGTIINSRHILTAAHCVFRNAYISKEKLKVAVGDFILNSEEDGKHKDFEIEKIIVHYGYKPSSSHVNDIAVIKLNQNISFNERVQPVCLPDKDFPVYDKPAILSGWGRLNGTDPKAAATKLQKLKVKVISNQECKEMVKHEFEEILQKNLSYEAVAKSSAMGISETQLCAISTKTNSSACYGDSGGPLVMEHEDDGRYVQVGVVSYGLGKCRTDRQIPGSYTNVKKYLNFIAAATSDAQNS